MRRQATGLHAVEEIGESGPQPARAAKSRTRAVRSLTRRWNHQRVHRKPLEELPLSALLLSGLTIQADEGPAVDILEAVHDTLDELKVDAMGKDKRTVRISVTDLTQIMARIEVAAELVRRGPGAL
jgi:hypothetical protein